MKRSQAAAKNGRRKSRRLEARGGASCESTAQDNVRLDCATKPAANSHETNSFPFASFCNDSERFLDNFIKSKKEELRQTVPTSSAYSTPRERTNVSQQRDTCFDGNLMSEQGQWALRISNLPVDFFSSNESKLLSMSTGSSTAKPTGYRAIVLDDKVLSDLRSYFESQVEPHTFRSQCLTSYAHLKTSLGQLCRYSCAVGRSQPLDLQKSGEIFKISEDEKLLRAFVLGMKARCTATTVCSKASTLLKWVKFSGLWYAKSDRRAEKGRCDISAEFLRSTAAAEKREGRRSIRNLRSPIERLQLQHMQLAEDFTRAQERAEICLRNILSTAQSMFCDRGVKDIEGQQQVMYDLLAERNGALMKKWGINFLNLVVLHGGGQRAQVYCEMQLDAFSISKRGTLVHKMPELKRVAKDTGYFYLQTSFEKRQRSEKMPYIRLPASIADLYLAHRSLCRPAILKRAGRDGLEGPNSKLILNTENGCPLSAKQVSASVKSFFKFMDAELGPVTPLVIRKSFATIMYKRYLNGEIHREKTRSQFLEFLAERLNTSVEQLEDSYCAQETAEEAVYRVFSE